VTNRNAALLYLVDEYHTEKSRIMGRHSANEGFLSAFSKYTNLDKTFSYVHKQAHHEHFFEKYKQFSGNAEQHAGILFANPEQLQEPGCLYIPDPSLAAQANIRSQIHVPTTINPHKLYSLCGVTHTLSSEGAIGLVRQLLLSPVQPWDALVCTSRAAKSVVENIFNFYRDYYARETGNKNIQSNCQLPVIPLGVNIDNFVTGEQREKLRQHWRKKLSIPDNAVVFLFFGRLSFHAKANPYSMFSALEAAKKQTGKDVHLLMVGQYANKAIEKAFLKAQKLICPSVTCHQFNGGDKDISSEIWYAADVFTSLVDNIQETFGLTPIEAMAAGLPVVVTDWDGYKDTVQHGKQGYRIPTIIPASNTIGLEFAQQHHSQQDNYNHYIANVANHVAVDIHAATKAYIALIEQKDLRDKMGSAARTRAEHVYDWKHIIHSYQDLWTELTSIRQSKTKITVGVSNISVKGKPPFIDPYLLFQNYPTAQLDLDNGALVWSKGFSLHRVKRLFNTEILHSTVDVPYQVYQGLYQKLQQGNNVTIVSLLNGLNKSDQLDLLKCISRCLKLGAVNYLVAQNHQK
jgi:glycosyltransferase involved in cell wall biosynthesis